MKKRSKFRRRSFLIDSNLQERKKPKRLRNSILNSLSKIWSVKIWRWQVLWPFFLKALFAAMAGFILFSALSPYYKLKSIVIDREDPLIDIDGIRAELKEYFGQNTLFLAKEEIQKTIINKFPEFQKIEITNKWPDEISIQLQLAPSIYTVLNEADATFHTITDQGIVLEKKEATDLPVLKLRQYEKPIQPRTQLVEPQILTFVAQGKSYLETELELPVKEVRYLYAAQEIHFIVQQDTALWMTVRIPLEDQLKRLVLGADKATLYSNPPVHIDLRIPSQFYWLPR